ncbi:MAG: twin-arginine translocase TatA/TatE family subunit [Planctomycetes bacterium]|nr:twin-arginine translocase TatA/TatE family subunit [Planctomycetota bacterium]
MFLALDSALQILMIVGVLVLLFGAGRIPDTMRNLGRGVSEFKKGLRESEDDARKTAEAKNEETAKKS